MEKKTQGGSMKKRKKRISVSVIEAKGWLNKVEGGASIEDIRKSTGADCRTIRKHIAAASDARLMHEVKVGYGVDVLTRHHKELCDLSLRMYCQVDKGEAPVPHAPEVLLKAFKQHTPRWPLWKYLKEWNASPNAEVGAKLKDELMVAPYRRVLPGHCVYCPF